MLIPVIYACGSWRRTSKPPDWTCDGFAVACQMSTGNYFLNERLLSQLTRAIAQPVSPAGTGGREIRCSAHVAVGAQPEHIIGPMLHSMFLETEINFGGEGGLYAELVRNRDFEALGRGCVEDCQTTPPWNLPPLESADGRDPHEPAAILNDFRPWRAIGSATLQIDNSTSPFKSNPHSLLVERGAASGASKWGVSNPGYWGISVSVSTSFKLTLYARSSSGTHLRLRARLTGAGGQHVLGEASLEPRKDAPTMRPLLTLASGWSEYSAIISPSAGAAAAALEVLADTGTTSDVFWLDAVSLMPTDAIAGLSRRDLFAKLQAMRPGFVRIPGGNYLEGFGMRSRWAWRTTLGHWAARPGHYNAAWGYWVTDGFGLFEMLKLCELIGAAAQLSIYTGYSIRREYMPIKESGTFVQEALDAIEFANGRPVPNASGLAAIRISMGHPAPFGLNRLEVGNEERSMAPKDYPAHYNLITKNLRAHHPALEIVASGRWRRPGDVIGSPCLTGQERCDMWDEHFYQTPDEMASMGGQYDVGAYNRSWPRVFVGEFAANKPSGAPTLRAAIAESIFMLGFERNADVVTASAFAPLLNNVRGTQWPYCLINFNASRIFVLPSYHVQRMLSEARGNHSLSAVLSGEYGSPGTVKGGATASAWSAAAALVGSQSDGHITIKLANYAERPRTFNVSLTSWAPRTVLSASADILTAPSPWATNTLEEPNEVAPKSATPPQKVPTGLLVKLPSWCLAVVHVQMSK